MFRIRILNNVLHPVNRNVVDQIEEQLRVQFPEEPEQYIRSITDYINNPFKHGFAYKLLVADNLHGKVRGFALVSHAPALQYLFIDYLAVNPAGNRGGLGSALYGRVREMAVRLGCRSVLLECLVEEEPGGAGSPAEKKERQARLRFYERLGVFPFAGNGLEEIPNPHDGLHYYLSGELLEALPSKQAARIVESIYRRKYPDNPGGNRDGVVSCFRRSGFRLREPKHTRTRKPIPRKVSLPLEKKILLTISRHHRIHHSQARGYAETPVRLDLIEEAIMATGLFYGMPVRRFPVSHILAVHDRGMVNYLRRVCTGFDAETIFYPDVFPLRGESRPPRELAFRAGYYCFDIYSPLSRHVYRAAVDAVNSSLTLADMLLQGHELAYALVRPPGHHAESTSFGGFCYFNAAAAAAELLSEAGPIAVLDLDYHHGNGTEEIFYRRSDVLTLSIHADPDHEYPYFSGHTEDTGEGEGAGYNVNYPLPFGIAGDRYRTVLQKALRRIVRHNPAFLVVPLGLDTAKGDPSGKWLLTEEDYRENGRLIGGLGVPVLVVQEGGYGTDTLGRNAAAFLHGLWHGYYRENDDS